MAVNKNSSEVLLTSFLLPYPKSKAEKSKWLSLYGLNAIYAGKHWKRRSEGSEFWHLFVQNELRKQKIAKKVYTVPVYAIMFWDDNLDIDNHAYMGKMIVDAMKGWLITDDNRKYLTGISHKFWDENKIRVEIWTEKK